jgi:diguanylate cyclase (GGDEF)-like protein
VIIDDLTEPGFPGDLLLIEAGIRSLVSVTILGPEGPWGSLTAMSKDAASFNLSDANAIQALANIIAAAADRDRGEAERRHQKLYDPVTDLPGRALLTDRIELALSSSTRLDGAILAAHLIDLDAFRRINDSLGYDAGDTLLAQVGERLSGIMSNDETVASLGGDVFVVVSRHPDEQSPHLLSERILDAVRNPFSVRDQVVGLTASIGVVVAHDEDRDANALLRDAESAMYEAKRLGRDRSWVFNHDHRRRLMDRLGIEADLRAALASDQLDVYYQPIVDCRSGHVVSVEALVRWHHPINGLVPPDQFIEIAEESGLILPLGQWVLETACAQLAAWRAQPDLAYLGMSVNLSARQLGDPGLLDKTLAALDAADLDPTGLSFEITETMVVADLPGATKALEDLNALGIRIVIDDFGTGYSSLSYVKNLPITCIKIDRSFISGIERDSADRSIVAALATLARELDILVVAEGVDSRAQLVIVQKLGCTLIQGYLYAPALPAGAFDVWARAHEDAI